jgi:hypothetical protein
MAMEVPTDEELLGALLAASKDQLVYLPGAYAPFTNPPNNIEFDKPIIGPYTCGIKEKNAIWLKN